MRGEFDIKGYAVLVILLQPQMQCQPYYQFTIMVFLSLFPPNKSLTVHKMDLHLDVMVDSYKALWHIYKLKAFPLTINIQIHHLKLELAQNVTNKAVHSKYPHLKISKKETVKLLLINSTMDQSP